MSRIRVPCIALQRIVNQGTLQRHFAFVVEFLHAVVFMRLRSVSSRAVIVKCLLHLCASLTNHHKPLCLVLAHVDLPLISLSEPRTVSEMRLFNDLLVSLTNHEIRNKGVWSCSSGPGAHLCTLDTLSLFNLTHTVISPIFLFIDINLASGLLFAEMSRVARLSSVRVRTQVETWSRRWARQISWIQHRAPPPCSLLRLSRLTDLLMQNSTRWILVPRRLERAGGGGAE